MRLGFGSGQAGFKIGGQVIGVVVRLIYSICSSSEARHFSRSVHLFCLR